MRCLQSIAQHGPRGIAFETIIVLNEVDAAVEQQVRQTVSGATFARSAVNLGLAGAANLGRSLARGELLLLLHDDAEVLPGWMEALVETADAYPDAGAIGSKILFPDGRLQHAGAILWSNALTSRRWAGETPSPEAFGSLEVVDYCPTSSLLVRASAFDTVGGFDEDFYPAIYVDADLCTALRCAGHVVMMEPRSQIHHHRHASTEPHFRRFVWLRNKQRFQDKWAAALERQEPFDDVSAASIERATARTRAAAKQRARRAAAQSPPFALDPALQQAQNTARAYALQKALAGALQAAVDDAEADRINLRESNSRLLHEAKELHAAIGERDADRAGLQQAHDMLAQRHRDLAAKHEALSQQHRALEQRGAAVSMEFRELQQTHNALLVERRDLLQMQATLAHEHQDLQRAHEGLRHEIEQSRQAHERLAQRIAALERNRHALLQSHSWRITAPLRYLSGLVRGRA